MFVDLDDFKSVNDGLGHAAGDDLLIAIGERLRSCMRPGDTVARLGGDEFAILLECKAVLPECMAVADRMLEVLQLPLTVGNYEIGVRASESQLAMTTRPVRACFATLTPPCTQRRAPARAVMRSSISRCARLRLTISP